MRLTCNISPSTPLLTTKLYIPRGRSALVSRPRLVKCLNEGPSHTPGVILISAPAGSGKTTLVVEWSRQAEHPIAWVSLDKGDNDPARFLAYIVAALDMLEPGIGQDALALLGASHSLSVEAVLTVLINEFSMLSHPLTLALDDYHFIDEPLIHDGLTFLLDHLPPQLHLILTSRVDPPLPLARLRSRNQLTELRAADLRFTPNETAAFLNQVMGLKLGADDLTRLEVRTEGWITGLQFAALSIRKLHDLEERQRFIWQAHLLQQQGKTVEVDRLLDKLKQIARRSNFTPMMTQYARFKAAIALQRGDLSAVARWVKTSGLSLSDRPSYLQDDCLLLANFFIMQSHLGDVSAPLSGVTALLHHLLDVADSKGLANTAIHLRITLALACQRQKAFDQALDALERALTLAHPGGYVRRFVDYGPTLVPLLRRTWAGGIMSDYTAEILAAFDSRPTSERSSQLQLTSSNHQMIELVEPLTNRELEVLQYLAAGLSNQEIADKLIVSVYTVRAHLRNIYRKLDVHRRTQAVKLARQLQIL